MAQRWKDWIRLIRARQWIKNLFVLAPLLFSGRALDGHWQAQALLAFVAFCAIASAVYLMNDVVDRESDRAHPQKRLRPVASGAISVRSAVAVAWVLGLAGLAMSLRVGAQALVIAATYLSLNVIYSGALKRVVLLDVFSIAAFFVLRLLMGAAAVEVKPSLWLLLCGGLLALFLGFAKRRHELVLLGGESAEHREVLSRYSIPLLDQLAAVLLSVTVVSYIMYTVESETARLVPGGRLSYSTVFVLYGVVRYLYLVHQGEDGNPTDTLLSDKGLLFAGGLWVLYCGAVLYLGG